MPVIFNYLYEENQEKEKKGNLLHQGAPQWPQESKAQPGRKLKTFFAIEFFSPGNNFFLPVSHLDESTFLESKYETAISDYWAYGQSLQKTLGVQQ